MNERTMNRLNADSIQTIDDVKTWAREHEARMEQRLEQIGGAITELKKLDKRIKRNLWLITISTWISGSALGIVVGITGIIEIWKAIF